MAKSPDPSEAIEGLLRQSAPALPPGLKNRTLANCASHAAAQRQRRDRMHRQLTWAVAGVLAIQALTLFMVDSQNTRLMAGNSAPPPFTPISIAEITELWHQRSEQLAQLMEPPKVG